MNMAGATYISDPPLPFIDDPVEQNPGRKDLRAEAEAWLAAYPNLYAAFEEAAIFYLGRGESFGAKFLAERVRWETEGEYPGFKINNDHVAYIARKLVEDHPELLGRLRFRRTRY